MVFSFFKKDPKEAKKVAGRGGAQSSHAHASRSAARPATTHDARSLARPLAGPVNRSLNRTSTPSTPSFATTENAIPDRELARSLAMATAAKIDAIESEMSQDFLRPRGSPLRDNLAANSVLTEPVSTEQPAFEDEPEHANGQDQAAESVLRTAIETDTMGVATERGWLMLFEFLQQRGDKAGFERLTMQYALRFEHSAPGWSDYEPSGGRADPKTESPVVKLPSMVGAKIVKPLEHLKALAMTNATLTLDVSGVRTVDSVGAELLLRVFNAFKRSSHELIVLGVEQLLNPLRSAVEPGRRDTSDACWMLLLDVQRLLNRQVDFEEAGIQYCITYEVSPCWRARAPSRGC